jgi:hypothetical protein
MNEWMNECVLRLFSHSVRSCRRAYVPGLLLFLQLKMGATNTMWGGGGRVRYERVADLRFRWCLLTLLFLNWAPAHGVSVYCCVGITDLTERPHVGTAMTGRRSDAHIKYDTLSHIHVSTDWTESFIHLNNCLAKREHVKISREIDFVYLGNEEIYCVFKHAA